MSPLKIGVAAAGAIVLLAILAVAGTFVSYFIAAVASQHPPHNPFTSDCSVAAQPAKGSILLRFDVANAGSNDVAWLNYALHVKPYERNLSDWGYALTMRVPARGEAVRAVEVPLPSDYVGLRFSGVSCVLVNVVFADGSQQDYAASGDTFP